ncbi:putative endonuclease 4 isoform X2 [Lampetra fluviatilis]
MPRGAKRPSRRGRGGLGLGRDGDDDEEEEEGTQVVSKTGRSKQPRGGDDDEAKEVRKTRGFKESGGSGGDGVKETRGSKEPGGDEPKRTREPRSRPPVVPEPSQTPDETGTRVPSARSSSRRRRHAPVQNKVDKEKEEEGTSSEEVTEMRKSAGRKRRGTNKEDTVTPKRPRKRGVTQAAHDPVEAPAKGLGRKTAKTETGSPSQPKADVSVGPMLGASGGNSAGRGSHKFVGGHMSISGGLWKTVEESAQLGARAFGLFLTSQRTWHTKPLDPCDARRFRETCKQLGFTPDHIVPHGSYLLNCGSPSTETFEKSRAALVSELQRCEKLGLVLYNFHPGSSCGQGSTDACLERIASAINYAHERTRGVVTVIENMCGQGHTVGGQFEELRGIIDLVADQSRIGVCLDTCHAFAAGYDISSQEGVQRTLDEFHRVVGLKFLKAVHLNDSKGKLGCHLDRHENVGRGHIGLEGFRAIMNAPQLDHLPMILETPGSPSFGYEEEIALLYSLCR